MIQPIYCKDLVYSLNSNFQISYKTLWNNFCLNLCNYYTLLLPQFPENILHISEDAASRFCSVRITRLRLNHEKIHSVLINW